LSLVWLVSSWCKFWLEYLLGLAKDVICRVLAYGVDGVLCIMSGSACLGKAGLGSGQFLGHGRSAWGKVHVWH